MNFVTHSQTPQSRAASEKGVIEMFCQPRLSSGWFDTLKVRSFITVGKNACVALEKSVEVFGMPGGSGKS
jgi:hypothetical protein